MSRPTQALRRLAPAARLAAALAILLVVACAGLPTLGPTAAPAVVEDASVRAYLALLTLEDEAACRLTRRGGGEVMAWCRVYRDLDGERVIGAYDRITGVLAGLLTIGPDGRQTTLWARPGLRPPTRSQVVDL